MVTCRRHNAEKLNKLAIEALFGNKAPLVTLDGDIDSNPDNYINGELRTDCRPRPSQVPIYKGMKLYITQNVIKEKDYVNGMLCTVEKVTQCGRHNALRVLTKTGKRITITPWTDREHQNVNYYPIRPGYASTIHKVQGDEFKFIIIWLDMPGMPAAGYTALSRVAYAKDYLIGGVMTPLHFVPANYRGSRST